MTPLLSYLNVHPPAVYTPPTPSFSICPLPLAGSGEGEITISMIMTQIKLLKLITGHNTSFSVLIRKLIGNRLVCFCHSTFPLLHGGLIKRGRKRVIFQHRDEDNLPPNSLYLFTDLLLIFTYNVFFTFPFFRHSKTNIPS